jgi:hypothetical protein
MCAMHSDICGLSSPLHQREAEINRKRVRFSSSLWQHLNTAHRPLAAGAPAMAASTFWIAALAQELVSIASMSSLSQHCNLRRVMFERVDSSIRFSTLGFRIPTGRSRRN